MGEINDRKDIGEDTARLLEEAMKQPGVKEALEVNQTYNDLMDRTGLALSDVPLLKISNATRVS